MTVKGYQIRFNVRLVDYTAPVYETDIYSQLPSSFGAVFDNAADICGVFVVNFPEFADFDEASEDSDKNGQSLLLEIFLCAWRDFKQALSTLTLPLYSFYDSRVPDLEIQLRSVNFHKS
jgi:hypothetical protein